MPLSRWHLHRRSVTKSEFKHLEYGTATGPAALVTIPAGGEADVDIGITFPTEFPALPTVLIGSVGPLPAGIVIGDIELTGKTTTGVTVSIRVYNYTTAPVDVTADSVSVDWMAITTS